MDWKMVLLLILLPLIAFLAKSSLSTQVGTEMKGKKVSLVIKLLVSHFQMAALASRSSKNLPRFVRDFFRIEGIAGNFLDPSYLNFVGCELTPDYIYQMYFAVALPLALPRWQRHCQPPLEFQGRASKPKSKEMHCTRYICTKKIRSENSANAAVIKAKGINIVWCIDVFSNTLTDAG